MAIEILHSAEIPKIEEVKDRVRNIPACFIIPPSVFLADERVFPFLGPPKVAAEFEKNGNPVEMLDLSGFANFEDIVREFAQTTSTRHFFLTATTPQLPAAVRVVNTLREALPDATIILGGAHATLAHAGMVEDQKQGRIGRGTMAFRQIENTFDKVVVGDGEIADFFAIDPEYQAQVIDAGSLKSPLFLRKGHLEEFAYPARHLLDMRSYHYQIDGHEAFTEIVQLGCPFECGFCGGRDSNFLRIARPRTPEHAVAEIESVIQYGKELGINYSGVMFYDDELNVSTGNLEMLCRELIKLQDRLGIEMAFRGFVKAELFTPRQAALMYQAGFKILLSGIESGSDQMLQAMKKHTSREINSHLVTIAHDAGLKVKALMSLGHPGESKETVAESIEWVKSNLWPNWDDVDWTVITQYPGSPYFDHSAYDPIKEAWVYTFTTPDGEELRLYSREADFSRESHYYKGVPGEYEVYVWTDYLTKEQLGELRDKAEQETRDSLGLAPITNIEALQFEHSMGQHYLPDNILRRSGVIYEAS